MRKKSKKLSEKELIKTLDALYTAAGSMRGRNETKLFLRDLLTEDERVMLGRRILIAQLLLKGETYENITLRLGVGMDTIRRVNKWLRDDCPGYEFAISEMESAQEKRKRGSPYSFKRLKKNYPLHFLLFSVAGELKNKKKKS